MRITDYPQMMLAYLDPGAGSLILQLLAGGLAGLAVMGKLYWAPRSFAFPRGFGSGTSGLGSRIVSPSASIQGSPRLRTTWVDRLRAAATGWIPLGLGSRQTTTDERAQNA